MPVINGMGVEKSIIGVVSGCTSLNLNNKEKLEKFSFFFVFFVFF